MVTDIQGMIQVAVMAVDWVAVVLALGGLPFLLLKGSAVALVVVRVGLGLGSQIRLQMAVPAICLTPVAMMIVRLADYDDG